MQCAPFSGISAAWAEKSGKYLYVCLFIMKAYGVKSIAIDKNGLL